MRAYLFIYVFILGSAINSDRIDDVNMNRMETAQRVLMKEIHQQIQRKMVQMILPRGNSSQYTKRERLWGGRRDQKLLITNWHKTNTKVVVGTRGGQQEVKRRQRKTHNESLWTYAASATALAIQLSTCICFLSIVYSVFFIVL
jgi:hypothetical protein